MTKTAAKPNPAAANRNPDRRDAVRRSLEASGLPPLADPAGLKRREKPAEDDAGEPEGESSAESGAESNTESGTESGTGPLAALSTAAIKAVRARGGGWLLGLGLAPRGPLRLATSTDPAKLLREARMHNVGVGEIGAHVALLAPDATAAWSIREAVLAAFEADGAVIRAGLVNGDAERVSALARRAAEGLGIRLLTPAEVSAGLAGKGAA